MTFIRRYNFNSPHRRGKGRQNPAESKGRNVLFQMIRMVKQDYRDGSPSWLSGEGRISLDN